MQLNGLFFVVTIRATFNLVRSNYNLQIVAVGIDEMICLLKKCKLRSTTIENKTSGVLFDTRLLVNLQFRGKTSFV
jgi:hypothetical protein